LQGDLETHPATWAQDDFLTRQQEPESAQAAFEGFAHADFLASVQAVDFASPQPASVVVQLAG
jgi:hypothetical protein